MGRHDTAKYEVVIKKEVELSFNCLKMGKRWREGYEAEEEKEVEEEEVVEVEEE